MSASEDDERREGATTAPLSSARVRTTLQMRLLRHRGLWWSNKAHHSIMCFGLHRCTIPPRFITGSIPQTPKP
eukprot:1030115-Amphidinium_carterae.1